MAKAKEVKTNAIRILDAQKISYEWITYESDGFLDGVSVAEKVGLPPEQVYKTLVTKGRGKEYYVFVIPVAAELDLKKAAKSVGEKSVELIAVKEITAITGYVRGGCSPVGMKKHFQTVIHQSAEALSVIYVSAGKLGAQMALSPKDLAKVTDASFADLIYR